MSKTIWKYKLPRDGQTIEIHEYIVKVLHIAAQDGVPTLWAIVDPDRPRDGYTEIVAWGTGWPLPDDVYQECDYWGTCEDGYGYVWHYFAEESNDGQSYSSETNIITSAAPSGWLSGSASNIEYPQATLTTSSQGITINDIDGIEEQLPAWVEKMIEEQGVSVKRYVYQ